MDASTKEAIEIVASVLVGALAIVGLVLRIKEVRAERARARSSSPSSDRTA